MKRFWTALAVASLAILAVAGCNDYGNTFQANTGGVITFLSPKEVNAGGGDLTLTINGSGFVAKTVVMWNGGKLKTTVTTDSSGNVLTVTAVVPAALTAKPAMASVQTISPFSGAGNNGLSNAVAFEVKPMPNPVPTITSMSPMSAAPGSAALTLTITGTNFIPTSDPSGGSLVHWNTTTQTTLALVSVSASSIQATLSATLLATASTANVTVYNPPAPDPNCSIDCGGTGGGGTSNAATFTIGSGAASTAAAAAEKVAEETPAVSQNGRYVAYAAAQNGHTQVFVRDTCQSADASCQPHTVLLSAAADGSAGNDDSHWPSISSDGRYLAFSSEATNLVSNAPKGRQVYLRDTCLGASSTCMPSTQLISTDPNGTLVGTENILPSVSASGRFVAFLAVTANHESGIAAAPNTSGSSGSNSGYRQVFVRDTCLGVENCTPKTTRISLQPGDASGTGAKPVGPAISGSADHVALAGGNMATLFRRSVAVDDGVFLAITKENQ